MTDDVIFRKAPQISRRQFLQAAGGVTFLSLLPIGKGLFAAPAGADIPLFTALPYVQPGAASALADGAETCVIAWQTVDQPVDFVVEYGASHRYGQLSKPVRTTRVQGSGESDLRYCYAAPLSGLGLSAKHYYRVRGNGAVIQEGYFTTRRRRGESIRFVAFGDNSYGEIGERAIAYHAYLRHPDFVMNTGDNVYESGLDNEYARYFFPVYNADIADPTIGAPLLRSVPFYTVVANHDVASRDENGAPTANFTRNPDALAYYTAMHLPLNGPAALGYPTPASGAADSIAAFKTVAGDRYPRMANYSFDAGDAHFLCLDSNVYIDPTDASLQQWIEQDLSGTDAPWKFVVFHLPAFNAGAEHYAEQHMRVLHPMLEKHGVDFVLNGHEHVYQRTYPVKFAPRDITAARRVNSGQRIVPGDYAVDDRFDGAANTRPNGIIHILTGAGGKHLYDSSFNDNPANWVHEGDDIHKAVAKFKSARHSFTCFDIEGPKATMTQVDELGEEIDRIVVTKG